MPEFRLTEVPSFAELQKALAPALKLLDEDNNAKGDVMQAAAPLLKALTPAIVLSGSTLDDLFGIGEVTPLKAYMTLAMLRRAHPDVLNPVFSNHPIAKVLSAAALSSIAPNVLRSSSQALPAASFSPAGTKTVHIYRPFHAVHGKAIAAALQNGARQIEHQCSNEPITGVSLDIKSLSSGADHATLETASDILVFRRNPAEGQPAGRQWELQAVRIGDDPLPTLQTLGSDWLEPIEAFIKPRSPGGEADLRGLLLEEAIALDPAMAALGDFYAAVKNEMDSRRKAAQEILGDTLERFKRGELEGQTGQFPQGLINLAARATTEPKPS